jgi:hypothetical protein
MATTTSSKRAAGKSAGASSASYSSPVINALLVSAAVAYGLWLLVARGQLTWPPGPLLANSYTLAGSLGLVGPIVLGRRERAEWGLGDLAWIVGGLLIWVFDLAALASGEFRGVSWATPLGTRAMGLTILAVLLAGWRLQGAGRSWNWTNVVGWLLGIFWVAMGLAALLPPGLAGTSR